MRDPGDDRLAEALTYPAFNPLFVPVTVDRNTVHIRIGPWTGPIYTLRDRDSDSKIVDLLDRIDGETHVDEILGSLSTERDRDQAATMLFDLYRNDVVYDRSDAPDGAWSHLPLRRRFESSDRRRIADQSVLVVDCGSVAPQLITDLVDLGVESVQVNRPVPDAAGPTPNVEAVSDAPDLGAAVERNDFVVFTADRPYPGIAGDIDRRTQETGTPWTTAQVHGLDGIVGPTVFPNETACYQCFRERTKANVTNHAGYERYLDQMDAETGPGHRVPGLGRLVAGFLAMDLANLLAFGTGYTTGRVIAVDGLTLDAECNDVLKLPRCEVCGKDTGDTETPFLSSRDIYEAADVIGSEDDD